MKSIAISGDAACSRATLERHLQLRRREGFWGEAWNCRNQFSSSLCCHASWLHRHQCHDCELPAQHHISEVVKMRLLMLLMLRLGGNGDDIERPRPHLIRAVAVAVSDCQPVWIQMPSHERSPLNCAI